MSHQVLIIDDEANMRWVLHEALTHAGYTVYGASSGQEALRQMTRSPVDLIILDLKLKGMDGLTTLRHLRERWPEVVVIILTAYGTITTAVEAMQLGATDYLRKPFDVEEVRFKLQRAMERQAMQRELQRLRQNLHQTERLNLAGTHPAWEACIEQVRSLSVFDLDLVITGEAGVGKTCLARLAHGLSSRRDAPLVELDMRSIPPVTLAETLWGTERHEGAWSRAGAGALLLRHAEAVSPDGWAMIQERLAQRAGRGPRLLVTATMEVAVDALALPRVAVPPLRERREDVLALALAQVPDTAISPGALQLLEHYTWPGNVAELRAVVLRAAALADNAPIHEQHLPDHVRRQADALPSNVPIRLPPEGLSLEGVEVALLQQALSLAGGNKTRAAQLLGLTRHTLLYRLQKYGLDA